MNPSQQQGALRGHSFAEAGACNRKKNRQYPGGMAVAAAIIQRRVWPCPYGKRDSRGMSTRPMRAGCSGEQQDERTAVRRGVQGGGMKLRETSLCGRGWEGNAPESRSWLSHCEG